MLTLSLGFKLSTVVTSDKRNRTILKRNLDDEWAIVFVVQKNIVGVWKHTSIELHRKTTTRTFEISGELRYDVNGFRKWDRNISSVIKASSSFTEIVSNLDEKFELERSYLGGTVNISEEQGTILQNGGSKDEIQVESLQELSKDFELLLNPESSFSADVTLRCDGVSIPAHKNILSTRSPVFAAMFANPMKESLTNEVDVDDIEEPVLRALLKYIYTGRTSDMTVSSAADLLFAAEKYQLQNLKRVCIYFLKNTLSLENVWEVLVQGDMHSPDLKSFAVQYICSNCGEFSDLQKRREWMDLRKERPDLAMDLLESLLKYKEKKR